MCCASSQPVKFDRDISEMISRVSQKTSRQYCGVCVCVTIGYTFQKLASLRHHEVSGKGI